jgi:hypothetical protein
MLQDMETTPVRLVCLLSETDLQHVSMPRGARRNQLLLDRRLVPVNLATNLTEESVRTRVSMALNLPATGGQRLNFLSGGSRGNEGFQVSNGMEHPKGVLQAYWEHCVCPYQHSTNSYSTT